MILSHGPIKGFWDETLFPTIKDLARYGADTIQNSDFLDDLIDAFVDSAAGTLGSAAPEFLPAILSASASVKDPLHNLAHDALKNVSEWAQRDRIKGNHKAIKGIQSSTPYNPIMINTM